MDRDNHARKEPSLADLEAFEKLLRESLQSAPPQPAAEPPPAQLHVVPPAEPARTEPAPAEPVRAEPPRIEPAPRPAAPPPVGFDERAMAELARLIEAPINYAPPVARRAPAAPEALAESPVEAPLAHTHGTAEAAIGKAWPAPEAVHHPAAPQPVQPAPQELDPLAAFEEELRRFDAQRQAELAAPVDAGLPPELRPAYSSEPEPAPAYPASDPDPWAAANAPTYDDRAAAERPETPAEASLHAAEDRLAAEAAAAAAAAGVSRSAGRSKGIFLAMAGIAVAGVAIIGGSFVFGSGSSARKSGEIPVIAAKTDPTKERPANPGGMEIPNQNKQVLAVRNPSEVKPAQVVNTTEQPLDLNQVTKRDSVRVVAPNPYQPASGAASPTLVPNSAQPGDPAVEPRRVTSVRIPTTGGAIAAGVATGAVAAAPPTPSMTVPAPAAPTLVPVDAPRPPTPPARLQADASSGPVKVESRPVTATQPRTEPPGATTTPQATPPTRIAAAPRPATPPAANRPANAPLSLAPAASGGSGWAIQLASRPTENDARAASTQLKARYASTIGSRTPSVVSGEANGRTVYRIRVNGYSQAGATEACNKIKAAGGGCFVTRQ